MTDKITQSFIDWASDEYPDIDLGTDEDEFGGEYFTDVTTGLHFACYYAGYRHSRIDAAWLKDKP